MLDTSRPDDRAVAYFRLTQYADDLQLDWDALSSRSGLCMIALAAIGLDDAARVAVRDFVRRPEHAQLPELVKALKTGGPRFNARTRKELINAIERGVDIS